ncbi:MAG: putative lipid II flippase FtsW [Propioniciclava sp.]|uniref:putative lipid II flippase FtsW n=1 Tax=Propioniciclava sp. TaxID=2038686 RepID=UPI0039E63DE7
MAILTPSRPPGKDPGRSVRSADASVTDRASGWLTHPMADVALVLVPTAILVGLGILMVWSASTVIGYQKFDNALFFVQRHLVFLTIALVAGVVASRTSTQRLRSLGWLLYVLAAFALLLTFVPGLGYGVGGNKNWLALGGPSSMLRFQPSEVAKLALVVWGASVLANKRRLLDQPKHLLVPFLPFSLLLIGLVVLQHDLGTAMIMGAIVMAILWCVGAPWRILGSIFALVAAGVGILLATGNQSRLARIFGFLDPSADPTGVNHQPMQALYGLATGGWLGVGLGRSRQKWGSLADAPHTDYVLAVIGEELGVVATLIVFALFLVLAWGGVRIALRTGTFFGRLVAASVTAWLLLQALINMMVVLRMLPVLGVPLPFLSYGSSSMLANLAAVGILVACAREEPQALAWLKRRAAARGPRRRLSMVLPGRNRDK